jgi:hypothetical protein
MPVIVIVFIFQIHAGIVENEGGSACVVRVVNFEPYFCNVTTVCFYPEFVYLVQKHL